MAKRFTDTDMWDKEWFMNLSPRLKCLVKMVRDKCDLSGVWSPNWVIAKTYVGEKVTEKELLEIDGGKQFVKISGGKIYCIGFIEFQYGTLGEKSPVHRKILNLLNTHKIDYKHPINRVEEEEEEKVEEIETEEEKEKVGKKKPEIVYPFHSIAFLERWAMWKQYKKDQHGFTYKGVVSEQGALKRLSELSKSNEQTALAIIEQSISNGWQGFFILKSNATTTNNPQQYDPKIVADRVREEFGQGK